MKEESRPLLFLLNVGMELCWLYACTNFLTSTAFHQSFPFPEAVGSFLLAAALTLFSEGRGWRVIYIVALQASVFIPTLIRMFNIFNSWSHSFSSQTWLAKSPNNPIGFPLEYIISFLILIWIFMFWAGGIKLVKRPMDYFAVCFRFERGLLAFFLLFLVKFYMQVQGIHAEESRSSMLLFPFLIFSLFAIGLVRNRSTGPKDFLPGYQGMGVILSFIVVILLFSTGLVLFCLPYLTAVAETGYGVVKIISRPVGAFILMLIRFFFGGDFTVAEKPPVKKKETFFDSTSEGESRWWYELLAKILTWGVGIIVGLVLLLLLAVTLYSLYQWLFSKTSIDQERQSSRHLIARWSIRLRQFLHSCLRWLWRRMIGYEGAVQFYVALLSWGRHSGQRNIPTETPIEYGVRLKDRFPKLKKEIELIIKAFNQQVYGEIILDKKQLGILQRAWWRLRSPLNWPSRLKAWFIRRGD